MSRVSISGFLHTQPECPGCRAMRIPPKPLYLSTTFQAIVEVQCRLVAVMDRADKRSTPTWYPSKHHDNISSTLASPSCNGHEKPSAEYLRQPLSLQARPQLTPLWQRAASYTRLLTVLTGLCDRSTGGPRRPALLCAKGFRKQHQHGFCGGKYRHVLVRGSSACWRRCASRINRLKKVLVG